MGIMLYNFLQPSEVGSGGVGIYINNLAIALQAPGHKVMALSSGDVFTVVDRKPKIRNQHDGIGRSIIVNSPLVAPAADAFNNLRPYTHNHELDQVPQGLRQTYGNIDVFHSKTLTA